MKGVFQARPAVTRYTSTWDTSVVLLYLKGLHPATGLTLQQLTQKLVMLCVLVTGQRCQSLHLMNLGSMHMDTYNSHIFHNTQLVKQSAPGKAQTALVIPRFLYDQSLCVATVLDKYIKRTEIVQGNEKQLFISLIKPLKNVSKESISRWIKNVMQVAGIDTSIFKPHSTRVASASKVNSCQVPINSILKVASWSTDCVFNKFYNKPVQNSNSTGFGQAILSATVNEEQC